MLIGAGVEPERGRELVAQCRERFMGLASPTPVAPAQFLHHLRRLRNETCTVAKGASVAKVKRLGRRQQLSTAALATGASLLKAVAGAASPSLGPVGVASLNARADATVTLEPT